MKFDVKILIATIIAGVLAAAAGVYVNSLLQPTLNGILLVMVPVMLVALVVAVTILITTRVSLNSDDCFWFLQSRGAVIAGVAVCLVLLLGLTVGLEWVYERDLVVEETVTMPQEATGYIFILDESGSMVGNDPHYERYSALGNLMQSKSQDFPYAVYVFANDCARIRDMAPVSQGLITAPLSYDYGVGGGTYMGNALQMVYADIQSGALGSTANLQVILLADGDTFDMATPSERQIIQDYANAGIPVSTIALGRSIDTRLLEEIARTTGGGFNHVTDASQLQQGFQSSVSLTAGLRNLLSMRYGFENGVLYGILRVLFLTLIGAAFAFIKAMAASNSSTGLIIIEGSIAALVGALVVELCALFGVPAYIYQAVYLLLLAVTPGYEVVQYNTHVSEQIHGYQDAFAFRR